MDYSSPSFNNHNSHEEYQSSKSNRHPSNLRGKAIGLWYAQQQRSKNVAQALSKSHRPPSQPVATVELSSNEIQRVAEVHRLFDNQNTLGKNSRRPMKLHDNEEDNASIDDIEHAIQFERLYSSFQYFETLDRNSDVDQILLDDLRRKQSSPLYQNLHNQRIRLPISNHRQKILDTINKNQIFVLVGDTGSGTCLSKKKNDSKKKRFSFLSFYSSRKNNPSGSIYS